MKVKPKNIDLNTPSMVINTIFEWKGAGNDYEQLNPKIWTSKCALKIYRMYSMPVIVICSDLDKSDTGTSITNSCERVATLIWKQYKEEILGNNPGFVFIEHYPRYNQNWRDAKETFCFVQFNFDGVKFSRPRWTPLTPNTVITLINQPSNSNQDE